MCRKTTEEARCASEYILLGGIVSFKESLSYGPCRDRGSLTCEQFAGRYVTGSGNPASERAVSLLRRKFSLRLVRGVWTPPALKTACHTPGTDFRQTIQVVAAVAATGVAESGVPVA